MANEPLDASLFTRSRQADYWNDFYQKPASVFEHTMVQRRDYAHRYIVTHVSKTVQCSGPRGAERVLLTEAPRGKRLSSHRSRSLA